MATADDVTYFEKLGAQECRDLLANGRIGRVAWQHDHGIEVLPVNYRLVEDDVVFHTSAGSPLARLADPTQVSFQLDDFDEETAIGWSVLAHGTSGPAGTPLEARSWAPGVRVGVAITIDSLGGRVVSGAPKEQGAP